jgi:lipid A oxidase
MAARIHNARDRAGHTVGRALSAALLLVALAAPANADWTVAAYIGASFTRPAALTLNQTPASTRIADVHFEGKPFASPPYYGYRAGWRRHGGIGVDAELIHLKVYARAADLPPIVQRFSVSHGLNLLLGDVTWAAPARRRAQFELRAGAGVAIPHGESEIQHVIQEQYEVSSLALQGAAGLSVRLTNRLSAFGEYKLTTAAPAVSVAGGHIKGRYTSQHAAFGLAWNFVDVHRPRSEQQKQIGRSRD